MFKTKISPKFFYIGAVLLIIFLLGLAGILKPLRKAAEKTLVIPLRQQIFDLRQFVVPAVNDQAVIRITELEAKIASLEEENKQQKRLLSIPLPSDWQFLSLKVIGVENETLLVYLPDNQGIRPKMVGISADTYLGKISQITSQQAIIQLPSFLDSKLAVNVYSQKDHFLVAKGLLVGGGEGKMRLEQVLLSENIIVGDLVMTSIFGQNLLVGKVSEVLEKKGEMFKSAIVKRDFNPRQLQTIFLINK